MRKTLALSSACTLLLAACSPSQSTDLMSSSVPVAVVQDGRTALASYQAALGVVEVALRDNPQLLGRVNALTTRAQPYVDSASSGMELAGTTQSLTALAAELLIVAAPHIVAIGNGK